MSVILEKKNQYSIITLHNPDKLNAINAEMLKDLKNKVTEVITEGFRVLIITGAGDKAFSSGADIASMQGLSSDQGEELARLAHKVMNAIAGSDLISIAAINGYCLGGGLELALACDLRIATPQSKLGLPEVSVGLIPGFGGTQRLPRIISRAIALEMILTGRQIDGEEAKTIGLVNSLHDANSLMKSAEDLAMKLIHSGSPSAQKISRWMVNTGTEMPITAALEREIVAFGELFNTKETKEGIHAFIEKRKPVF